MLGHQEVLRLYGELSNIAHRSGLDWLLEDVERQIALGKESTKNIQVESTISESNTYSIPKQKGRPSKFIVMQPFSEREKVLLLIEAIEASSVGLSLGLTNAYATVAEICPTCDKLGFAPDTEKAKVRSIESDVLQKKPAIEKLKRLLQELKEAV